jgi:predicted aspartyl protease
MQLQIRDSLPFVTVELTCDEKTIEIPNVLVDTGSGGTIFSVDLLSKIGIKPQANDPLMTIQGIGGSEVVFVRQVDAVRVGEFSFADFEIEVGSMDYGIDMQGILGMDFLIPAGAQIDLKALELTFSG